MKAVIASIIAVSALAVPASAANPIEQSSPILGKWAVDVAKLPIPPQMRPKSVTFTFAKAKGDQWSLDVNIVGGGGDVRHSHSEAALDGSAVLIDGDTQEADSVSLKLPAPNVLIMGLSKGGVPSSTRVYVVSPDGKTMVETTSFVNPQGKPVLRSDYLTRIK